MCFPFLPQIDYPDAQFLHPGQRQSCSQTNLERLMALEHDELKVQNKRGRSLSEDQNNIQQSYSDSEVGVLILMSPDFRGFVNM